MLGIFCYKPLLIIFCHKLLLGIFMCHRIVYKTFFYVCGLRLVGQGPFWHRKDTVMYRNIMEGNYKFQSPEWDDISEGPKDLVKFLF